MKKIFCFCPPSTFFFPIMDLCTVPFVERVQLLRALPEGSGPVEHRGGSYPFVSAQELKKRIAIVSAKELYQGATFEGWILKHVDDGSFCAFSLNFPETCGAHDTADKALKELVINAESTLHGAMRECGLFRVPTILGRPLTAVDVANSFDVDFAHHVEIVGRVEFQVFSSIGSRVHYK